MTKPSFKVCFVISEAEPLIKVGGLGDVGGTLPAALTALPHEMTDGRDVDVRVVIPYHDILKERKIPVKWVCNFRIPYDNGLFQDVYVSQAEGMDVPMYLIDGDPIRGKGVYSSDPIVDAYKYVFFSDKFPVDHNALHSGFSDSLTPYTQVQALSDRQTALHLLQIHQQLL